MNLFQGEYVWLHSHEATDFKIDCDALTDDDLVSLAKIISRKISFGRVYGIPRGGERLVKALEKYKSPYKNTILVVDDVLTTGSSFRQFRRQLEKELDITQDIPEVIGICIFCRRPENKPDWVMSVFDMKI